MKKKTTSEINVSGYYWYQCLGIVNFWEMAYIFKDYTDGPWMVKTFNGKITVLSEFIKGENVMKYEWCGPIERPQ